MTDSDLFNIDESLNRVYKELSSHQSRLDSMEQLAAWRLELVNFNRILSLLPKPVLPSQENGDVDRRLTTTRPTTGARRPGFNTQQSKKIPDDNDLPFQSTTFRFSLVIPVAR